jgi:hypothetical protein
LETRSSRSSRRADKWDGASSRTRSLSSYFLLSAQ